MNHILYTNNFKMKLLTISFTLFFLCAIDGIAQDKIKVDPSAINFILMGDWGRNGADHQKEVAKQMGITATEASVDFIISAGDNFYPKGVASEFDPLWQYSFEDIYTDFSLQWDWYPVLGNHDYGANPQAQVAYSQISRRWKMPARYYSKVMNVGSDDTQALFVFIDTPPLIKGYYKGDGHRVHDQDSTAQKKWLEETLRNAPPTVKWKFVIGHHPMYTGGGRTENHDTQSIRRSLQPLFEKYKVDAYLAGHEHSLQHMVTPNNIHHFISGAASEITPSRMLPISKFSQSQYGFMLFSVFPQTTRVQVIDFQGKLLYTTELKKETKN
ncbi:MAG: acid phosphatase [Cytophagia bacterium]|nr:acid phosphatase [Cytophagia bacterium]